MPEVEPEVEPEVVPAGYSQSPEFLLLVVILTLILIVLLVFCCIQCNKTSFGTSALDWLYSWIPCIEVQEGENDYKAGKTTPTPANDAAAAAKQATRGTRNQTF